MRRLVVDFLLKALWSSTWTAGTFMTFKSWTEIQSWTSSSLLLFQKALCLALISWATHSEKTLLQHTFDGLFWSKLQPNIKCTVCAGETSRGYFITTRKLDSQEMFHISAQLNSWHETVRRRQMRKYSPPYRSHYLVSSLYLVQTALI